MNTKNAANEILQALDTVAMWDQDGVTIEHALWMLEGIALGYIQHEKAHRWLGYAQAILVTTGTVTLEQMKRVNKEST